MLIDWVTVAAQIVNFLVLVALMKRFLYGPLVAAIDAREKSFEDRLTDAARKESEAAARIEQLARQAADAEREKAAVPGGGTRRCGPAARGNSDRGARRRARRSKPNGATNWNASAALSSTTCAADPPPRSSPSRARPCMTLPVRISNAAL